jgi:hypothetical protein
MSRKISITLLFTMAIASLILVVGFFPGPALGADVAGSSAYTGGEEQRAMMTQQALPPDYICTGDEKVLLIQDNVPWAAPGDILGANVDELLAQGIDFCIINSADIGSWVLGQFSWILIAGAQNQGFYDNLFPGGGTSELVHPALVAYVQAGGILSANLTDHSSGPGANGNWDDDTFVGGLQHVAASFRQDNGIADPTHLIITADGLSCPSGNCGTIQDTGPKNDLDDWGWSSHGYFTSLPVGTTVILTDTDGPVMIEYPFGAGKVIATLSTIVWRYVGGFGGLPQNKKLLANEIAYQEYLANPRPLGALPVSQCLKFVETKNEATEVVEKISAKVKLDFRGCIEEKELKFYKSSDCSGTVTPHVFDPPDPNLVSMSGTRGGCNQGVKVKKASPVCVELTLKSGRKTTVCW